MEVNNHLCVAIFCQAEDGIRDLTVTGVQTCALPIFEALAASGVEPPADHAQVAPRLLERLHRLSADASRRACVFEEAAGPDTLLHGDLWPINAVVAAGVTPSRVRLVDWDRLGVGPFSYDLSTFLFRFPPDQRPGLG